MAVIKEGAKAPAFKGADQHGKTVSIADFKGQKLVYTSIQRTIHQVVQHRLATCVIIIRN